MPFRPPPHGLVLALLAGLLLAGCGGGSGSGSDAGAGSAAGAGAGGSLRLRGCDDGGSGGVIIDGVCL